jgi:hypothetical protein
MPSGLPDGPIVSKGGYDKSIPTTSVLASRLPQAEKMQAESAISEARTSHLAAVEKLTASKIPRFFDQQC